LRLTGRSPDAAELELLRELYDEQRAIFLDKAEQDAAEFVKLGESTASAALDPPGLAALTVVCQAILNLDATIFER
jgi:hypothetical protein